MGFQKGNTYASLQKGVPLKPEHAAQVRARLAVMNAARKGVPKTPEHAAKLREVLKRAHETRRSQGAHRLSDFDELTGSATCVHCGRVPVKLVRHENCIKQPEMNGLVQKQCYVGSLKAKVSYPNEAWERWNDQGGHCAICLCELDLNTGQKWRSAVLDHDHDSKLIRAWICRGCNVGIGNLQENPEVMRAAAKYIEEHASRHSSVSESWAISNSSLTSS